MSDDRTERLAGELYAALRERRVVAPLIEREHRYTLRERLDVRGNVLIAPQQADIDALVQRIGEGDLEQKIDSLRFVQGESAVDIADDISGGENLVRKSAATLDSDDLAAIWQYLQGLLKDKP